MLLESLFNIKKGNLLTVSQHIGSYNSLRYVGLAVRSINAVQVSVYNVSALVSLADCSDSDRSALVGSITYCKYAFNRGAEGVFISSDNAAAVLFKIFKANGQNFLTDSCNNGINFDCLSVFQ